MDLMSKKGFLQEVEHELIIMIYNGQKCIDLEKEIIENMHNVRYHVLQHVYEMSADFEHLFI